MFVGGMRIKSWKKLSKGSMSKPRVMPEESFKAVVCEDEGDGGESLKLDLHSLG